MVRQARQVATLGKVSDTLNLSQSELADYVQTFVITPLRSIQFHASAF